MSSLLSRVGLIGIAAIVAMSLASCSRRDDGSISADPDAKLHAGFPVVYVAPSNAGAPAPSNPLAMNAFKHDAPASAPGAAGAGPAPEPYDPCVIRDQKGPLAMHLRHDGPADASRRNPLCMRLK